ncbi:MAG: hypothetical protein IJQ89_07160 [Bacteroidales bacterium]|jgi:hypothetical protein|nr:hypothetical protein [Bacteroidales bacterium]
MSKKGKKITISVLVALLIISNITTLYMLLSNRPKREHLADKLELTGQAREDFVAIKEKYKAKSKPTIDSLRQCQAQLLVLTINKDNDSLLEATKDQVVCYQHDLLDNILAQFEESRAMLDSAQRVKLDSFYFEKFQCPINFLHRNPPQHRKHGQSHSR